MKQKEESEGAGQRRLLAANVIALIINLASLAWHTAVGVKGFDPRPTFGVMGLGIAVLGLCLIGGARQALPKDALWLARLAWICAGVAGVSSLIAVWPVTEG